MQIYINVDDTPTKSATYEVWNGSLERAKKGERESTVEFRPVLLGLIDSFVWADSLVRGGHQHRRVA